jgi:hypothetical protein
MVGFGLTMMVVFFVHALLDCMCAVLVLFYPSKIKANICDGGDDGGDDGGMEGGGGADAGDKPCTTGIFANLKIDSSAKVFLRWWNSLLDVYYSLFVDSAIRDSEPIFMRVFMYWMAAMSLVRVMALVWPCAPTLITVAIMYLLEALSVEFEAFTHKTVKADYARRFSLFCAAMSLFSFLLAIFV